ncbi:hypothetical protein ADK67_03210 [Saccharothrix sp. NRRL B-16348]|uniref:DUF5682 family protein n=1 Tax=Saccharothrix sp. NRRL B-16348 TaxID=1415542 RepID=UPI0006AF8CAB|nr:DUF5682 family protein [Saccharothrix sp. NRRL B-16348]KOX34488.1 hypothetical protein ADK67_03210 [Saccharothrix sp. NRRL B-16348]
MARDQPLPDRVTLLGIRHHGPGSARMVAAALAAVRPEVVLIEGPPEGDALLPHVPNLTPPVALLLHDEAEPARAAFWPFAEFSPEWRAMTWAHANGVPVRFFDLPAAASLAEPDADSDAPDSPDPTDTTPKASLDPLGTLAEAAGFDDPERWWEDVVEHHIDPRDLAEAVAEAMGALREEFADQVDARTLRREAAMRQNVRQALKDVEGPIVVVAGAWHVPALRTLPPASVDATALKGLPRKKVSGTWVPWSHGRLAASSGYGAGIASPGWYAHLWECAERGDALPRWFAKACAVLRAEDLPASTASAVEAVRLADALAAMRGRPSPGLSEVMEASLAVLCGGDATPLRLVHEQLVVGERLGEVGDDVPTSPLAADLARLQRRLRMPASAAIKPMRFDLRKDTDRERSKLLRRLEVLDVPWGTPDTTRTLGTFAEAWQLHWRPEFAVALAVAARHGTTVEAAARTVLIARAAAATRVVDAAEALSQAVGCEIPEAVAASRQALDRCAAATDALELLAALPDLATTVRYGSVRGTDPELLRVALHGLLARGAVGLPLACRGVDEDTAERAVKAVEGADDAVRLAADDEHRDTWQRALKSLVAMPDAHGLPTGRATRLLWETGALDSDEVAARLHRAVSLAAGATAFVAGFLRGSAALLTADPRLFGVVDEWLTGLSGADFAAALPLLRRAVGDFSPAERRMLGDRVKGTTAGGAVASSDWDEELAARLVGHVRDLLGASA